MRSSGSFGHYSLRDAGRREILQFYFIPGMRNMPRQETKNLFVPYYMQTNPHLCFLRSSLRDILRDSTLTPDHDD
jgi:hypothetical protein